MWSGTRKMRLTNGMAGFQSLPFLTNQKIISVIFWLVHIIQSDSCISSPIRWHSNDAVTMQQSTNMTSQTHVNVSTKHADTTAMQHRQYHGNTAVIPRSFKMNNMEYICTKCFENFATEDEYIPLGEQSPCRLRDGNAISVEWIFVKRFERSVHSATEHPDALIFTPHDSLGDLWHPPVNPPRATKHVPMSQVANKNEHTAPSSPPLSPEETPWKAK